MAAHTYWRLLELTQTAQNAVACAEVTMASSYGGGNLCTGGTPSASTTFTGQPASYAFDGNPATFWASNNISVNTWLQYAFAAPVNIVEVTILPRGDSYANTQGWLTFQLQYSDDGVNFFTVQQWTAGPWTIGVIQTFDVPAGASDQVSKLNSYTMIGPVAAVSDVSAIYPGAMIGPHAAVADVSALVPYAMVGPGVAPILPGRTHAHLLKGPNA